jgi:hypothetical protein
MPEGHAVTGALRLEPVRIDRPLPNVRARLEIVAPAVTQPALLSVCRRLEACKGSSTWLRPTFAGQTSVGNLLVAAGSCTLFGVCTTFARPSGCVAFEGPAGAAVLLGGGFVC